MAQFKDLFTELRRDTGLSQEDFAALFHQSGSTISSYETGRNQPSFDMLIQYADYFNVTTDYLLGRVPFDMSPSVFTDSFIDNVTIQDVISILQKLPDNRRRALLVLLGDIQLSSTIQEQSGIKSYPFVCIVWTGVSKYKERNSANL